MPRVAWSIHAYQLIEPDEQLDLFACRAVRMHLVIRQLELAGPVDRTLCGGLLPASPRWCPVAEASLFDERLCPACLTRMAAQRRGDRLPESWS